MVIMWGSTSKKVRSGRPTAPAAAAEAQCCAGRKGSPRGLSAHRWKVFATWRSQASQLAWHSNGCSISASQLPYKACSSSPLEGLGHGPGIAGLEGADGNGERGVDPRVLLGCVGRVRLVGQHVHAAWHRSQEATARCGLSRATAGRGGMDDNSADGAHLAAVPQPEQAPPARTACRRPGGSWGTPSCCPCPPGPARGAGVGVGEASSGVYGAPRRLWHRSSCSAGARCSVSAARQAPGST